MKYSIILSTLFLSFFVFWGTISAQGIGGDLVNIQMVPEIPKAGEIVYVFLTSYAINIDLTEITWRVNGKTIKSGTGQKTFSFKMGEIGKTTTLSILIKTVSDGIVEKTFSLKPVSVDLIWQSDSFVPPFYKGKAMFSHQNTLTVVAVPHIIGSNGSEISSKNLVYKWKKNGSVIEDASGFGRNTYSFEGSLISRPVDIRVEVSSSGGLGYAIMNLRPVDPYIVLYKKDPLYGIEFQKALQGDVELKGSNEISVIGMPFLFNLEEISSDFLPYNWQINGSSIDTGDEGNVQTFRKKEGVSGSSRISISLESPNKILQSANSYFNLIFSEKNNR